MGRRGARRWGSERAAAAQRATERLLAARHLGAVAVLERAPAADGEVPEVAAVRPERGEVEPLEQLEQLEGAAVTQRFDEARLHPGRSEAGQVKRCFSHSET